MGTHAKKTPAITDALRILESWTRDDPEMQRLLAEEHGYAAVSRQIHALRTARGLTQKELAERIGTKQPVIARLEDTDYEGHSLAMLYRIGAALGCDVSITFVPRGSAQTKGRKPGRAAGQRQKGTKRSARRTTTTAA